MTAHHGQHVRPIACARRDCPEQARLVMCLLVYGWPGTKALDTVAPLPVCPRHAREATADVAVSDDAWRAIRDALVERGHARPIRGLTKLVFKPLA